MSECLLSGVISCQSSVLFGRSFSSFLVISAHHIMPSILCVHLYSIPSHRCKNVTFVTVFISYMLSPVRLSVMFVRPTQAVQIFGNISTALGTLASIDLH